LSTVIKKIANHYLAVRSLAVASRQRAALWALGETKTLLRSLTMEKTQKQLEAELSPELKELCQVVADWCQAEAKHCQAKAECWQERAEWYQALSK